MDVRLARPTDAPLALALALDESAHIIKSFGWPISNRVSRTMLRTLLPAMAMPGGTWIARDGNAVALLEAQPRRYVIGWDIIRLVVRGDRERIVGPIVQAAVQHVQRRGVPRLFARCDDAASRELRAVGFHSLARELVLAGPSSPHANSDALPVDSRYRMPQDAWPLHQLESEITPPLVRQLEGLTSLDWSAKIRDMTEIVVERDGRVVAWIGWGVKLGHGYTQMGMLVHPLHAEVGPTLVHHALQTAPVGTRFVTRARDYQTHVLSAFEDAGFAVAAEEVLMIKHAGVEPAPARMRLKVAPVPGVPSVQIVNHKRIYRAKGLDPC
ncbi:MAG: hypothetical protein PVSMB7_23440 [Chloroflexota bacterium]